MLLKDRKNKAACRLMGKDMAVALQKGCILREDAIICHVPRSKQAYAEYGTDQAEELARVVADFCNLPYVRLLEHTTMKGTQKELDAKQRKVHAEKSYRLTKKIPDIKGKQIILVDDVLTTGATVHACAQLLSGQDASQVICLVAGKTQKKH